VKNSLIAQPFQDALRAVLEADGPCRLPVWPRSAQALAALGLRRTAARTVVVVTDGAKTLELMHRNLLALREEAGIEVLYYPAWEILPGQDRAPDLEIVGDRLYALTRLAQSAAPLVVTTCVQALMQPVPGPHALAAHTLSFVRGEETPFDELGERLTSMGYAFKPEVQNKGQAAIRGGLLDVWPPAAAWPVRIEFFGDVADSIRAFDPVEQTSTDRMDRVTLVPAGERNLIPGARSEQSGLERHLPDGAVLVWSDDDAIRTHGADYEQAVSETGGKRLIFEFAATERRLGAIAGVRQVRFGLETGPDLPVPLAFEPVAGVPGLVREVFQPDVMETARQEFLTSLQDRVARGQRVVLFFDTEGGLRKFARMYDAPEHGNRIETAQGRLSDGFACEQLGLLVAGEQEVYGYPKVLRGRYETGRRRGTARALSGERLSEWLDIAPGDLVVHLEHGIGKYLGLYEIELQGRKQEVLTLEYAENARLHVPVAQAHLLSRYVGVGRYRYKLHKLGGRRWQRERARAELSIRDLAGDLLEVQAAREALKGQSFSMDHPWQQEFEAAFPFTETDDQQRALREVTEDMASAQPMDRLICGDVGYGKTEVAMRAAFTAIVNGKQVAVLVPTTVLAQQHFSTFSQRMAAYPVRIEMLSRFRSRGRQRETVAGMADGTVDLVIGTHGLLQPGIRFKDLGLVVIDEEQRFGVEHKEHLKQLRKLVDVLTLTATPIPRTLYMSLTGAKDISTIQTPPQERLPVETIVAANTDVLVREAVLNELNREGQVYYLHNRVMTIERVKKRLDQLLPEARIEIAHGQMPARRLAEVMRRFAAGTCDVLLCTSIVESGLDIPNANTIFIDRADRFGMADLYQLRGRVGRSRHKGYAYLLLPAHGRIDEIARKRIGAIKKYSHFGASFKLALRDLEIRGAGNLLGAEQSGHIAAVGFGLYCQLLKRSVARLKGEKVPPIVDAELRLDFIDLAPDAGAAENAAVMPVSYIEDERMRVRTYRRIAEAALREDVETLRKEFGDRFGALPGPVERLLKMAEIRILAAQHRIRLVETRGEKLMLGRGKDDFVQSGGRFPRLKKNTPDGKLEEIVAFLRDCGGAHA